MKHTELISNLQKILDDNHQIREKREIDEHQDRIAFACPYCGDSQKDRRKKRGNLYLKNYFYVCFNCGKKTDLTDLFADFSVYIDPEVELEIIDKINQSKIEIRRTLITDVSLEYYIPLDEFVECLRVNKYGIRDLKPVQPNGPVANYLMDERKITDWTNFWECKYYYKPTQYKRCLVILNRSGNHCLGFQLRSISGFRIFSIHNFESCWKMLKRPTLSEDDYMIYNRLSQMFGILEIDFSQPITIFEGYIDSVFFPNSIGLTGLDTDISFLTNDEDLDLRFFFDNDKSGLKETREKLNQGKKVFLWKKFLLWILDEKNKSPMYLKKMNKLYKDLNDIYKNPPIDISKIDFEMFFSRDSLDIIDL